MSEEKKKVATSKTATKKKTTTTKATTKAKVETKEEVKVSEPMMATNVNQISPELMQQLFNQFLQMQGGMVQQTKVEEEVVEKPKKITKSYLRTIKDKEVVVRSVFGAVIFKSPKSRISYKWNEIGDEEILTVDEILAMDSHSKRFLNTPWLIVEDEEVIEGLGLKGLYETMEKIQNVEELLDMSVYEIEQLIAKAPHEYKKTLSGVIFEKVNNGELRDLILIKEFERILGTTLLL